MCVDDITIKNVRAGICGTDITIYLYNAEIVGINIDEKFGHEMVGIVGVDVDVFIDCVAAPNIPIDFFSYAKAGARLSCVGVQKEEVAINLVLLIQTEAIAMGSCGYGTDDILEVIEYLQEK